MIAGSLPFVSLVFRFLSVGSTIGSEAKHLSREIVEHGVKMIDAKRADDESPFYHRGCKEAIDCRCNCSYMMFQEIMKCVLGSLNAVYRGSRKKRLMIQFHDETSRKSGTVAV